MKYLFVVIVMFVLSGCTTTHTKVDLRSVYPPSPLMQECYPDNPMEATVEEVITIQKRAIDQCNDQLENLREWVERDKKETAK